MLAQALEQQALSSIPFRTIDMLSELAVTRRADSKTTREWIAHNVVIKLDGRRRRGHSIRVYSSMSSPTDA